MNNKTPFGTIRPDTGVLDLAVFPCKDAYRSEFLDALQEHIESGGYDEDEYWGDGTDMTLSAGETKLVVRRFVRRMLKNKKLKMKGTKSFYTTMAKRLSNKYIR